jgi:hypothetical protein
MAITQSQMRMLQRRRTSDVDRLAQQYKKNVEALTGDFESSFAQFQKQRAETMAPYEAELEKYKTQIYPDYEKQVEGYRQRLDAYNALIQDIEKNPSEMTNIKGVARGRSGMTYNIGGREYREADLPEGYFLENVVVGKGSNRGRTYDITEKRLFKTRDIPTFSEKAPVAPDAPQAPQAAEFDTAQFEQRRTGLESEYKRELGERRSGRLAAVSRRTRRPMLQGE